ncbi:MAG: NYN domain-containing protein [Anaerolineales bacterium]|nr:NYN domain-containing protein [Anaerolineales bacterium]
MEGQSGKKRTVNTALFVDFDNIFLSLAQLDNHIANEFATNPNNWMEWLEQKMPCICENNDEGFRRILIRRCYLNPQSFSTYRPYFIRAAFEVIDCPPLTTRGKTSTDIHMVMDILDALNHATHFGEFIILSGDADFTPVLLRLRKHARRSAVLSAGYVSPAYKASCDYLISQDEFIRDALGITDHEDDLGIRIEAKEINGATGDLLKRMASRLFEVSVMPGGIEASELPGVYKEFEEFRQGSHWLGFYSLRRLTEAIVLKGDGNLQLIENDPWRVARVDRIKMIEPVLESEPGYVEMQTRIAHQDVRTAIAEWINNIVRESRSPVTMAALAQAMVERFGENVSSTNWLGAGTFKQLLAELDLGDLELSSLVPGFVFDPSRHELPSMIPDKGDIRSLEAAPLDNFSLRYPEMAPLARKIHQLTDTPYLLPDHYAIMLRELAREINERGYQLTRTSKTVRDRCVEKGAPIARSHVNFVLIGIGYTGYRFGRETPETPKKLGDALVQNTLNLCQAAQLELCEEEIDQIRYWLSGALQEERV